MASVPDAIIHHSAKDIARICGVDLSTARRWKRGAICPPLLVVAVLSGDLSVFGPEWRGWKIRGDVICSPDGWTISRGDALTVPLMHGQIAALRADLRDAKATLEAMPKVEEQPNPNGWDITADWQVKVG